MRNLVLARIAVLAAAYVATAWGGLLLAVSPGYATGVWIPSGIALAACLAWGARVWPGIFLGSLVMNAFHGGGPPWHLPDATELAIGAMLALGSTLEVLVVGRAVRPRETDPVLLDDVPSVVRFAAVYAPAGCLVGASCAIGALRLAGTISPDAVSVFENLLTWWFGDWMGMVIVAPALLAISGATGGDWRGRRSAVALTALVGFGFVASMNAISLRQEQARLASHFDGFAGEIAAAAMRELEAARSSAGYLRDFLVATDGVGATQFNGFADGLRSRQGAARAVAWLVRVPRSRVDAYEQQRALAPPEAQLRIASPEGETGDTAFWDVARIVPASAAVDTQLRDTQRLREALARAASANDVFVTAPFELQAEGSERRVVVFMAGIGERAITPSGERFDGVAAITIEPAYMLGRLLDRREAGRVALAVRDVTGREPVPLYERALTGPALRGPALEYSRRFELGGRIWEFAAAAGQGYVTAFGARAPQYLQTAGLLYTGVLVCFMLVLSGRGARVRLLVAERTADLDDRNRELRAEMAERARVEDRLRETQRNFLDSLEFAQIGSWDFDVDSGQINGTREIARTLGLPEADLQLDAAAAIEMLHPADRERFAEEMRKGIDSDAEIALDYRIVRRDGAQRWLTTRSRRRIEGNGRVRLLGVMWDITDRVRAAERTQLLASVFEQGGEAIFIADAELRIVEVNPAFSRLSGLEPARATGMDAWELFAERSTREQFRGHAATARERGHWQGEIWGRSAEGGVTPQWLVLAAVRNEQGVAANYIGSFVDISERKHAEAKIEFLAHHDALTGLPNRFALQGRLEQAIAQAARDQGRVAVMFIDMDRFKDINDSLGHDVGDLLLLEIARRLRACVRASDIVARLGGDEFVVVLTGVADETAAAHMGAKLRQELGSPYPIRGRMLHSTPSIGISLYPEHGDTVDVLMRNSDAAMYRAKDQGRNNFQFFDISLSERARERIELAADLRSALDRGGFLLHFQPQVRASDGRFVAAEALIRWPHPERGMVPPDKFIGIAEEFGLIDGIGEWALNEACRELAALNAQGIRDFRVCVNLSPKQLHDRELPQKIAAAIAAAGIEARDLELELTESVAMQDPQSTIALLNKLYDSGVGLAIDDFGTGYSSLAYLKMLPLHNLKLDRSFVRDIEADPSDRAICSATVALAHALGIMVVAEGVETEAQRDFLLALGCDYLQGWLFSRPVPAEQLAALIASRPGH